jgi:hypothetical protein
MCTLFWFRSSSQIEDLIPSKGASDSASSVSSPFTKKRQDDRGTYYNTYTCTSVRERTISQNRDMICLLVKTRLDNMFLISR